MCHVQVVNVASLVSIGAVDVSIIEMFHGTIDARDTSTVAGDIAVEAPLVAQYAVEQPVVHGIGLAAP